MNEDNDHQFIFLQLNKLVLSNNNSSQQIGQVVNTPDTSVLLLSPSFCDIWRR